MAQHPLLVRRLFTDDKVARMAKLAHQLCAFFLILSKYIIGNSQAFPSYYFVSILPNVLPVWPGLPSSCALLLNSPALLCSYLCLKQIQALALADGGPIFSREHF